jgi:DNA-binding NarL/FixJ family response regulator
MRHPPSRLTAGGTLDPTVGAVIARTIDLGFVLVEGCARLKGRRGAADLSLVPRGEPRPAVSPRRQGHAPESQDLVREPLTDREIQILQLIANGLLNREIASELFLAEETVKTHIHHVLGKLRARSRAHAAVIGLRSNIIH